MKIDTDKIDEVVLALLYLTSSEMKGVIRAWKEHDWGAMSRLYEKGLISNPRSKAKSVVLSEEGARRSKELCHTPRNSSGDESQRSAVADVNDIEDSVGPPEEDSYV